MILAAFTLLKDYITIKFKSTSNQQVNFFHGLQIAFRNYVKMLCQCDVKCESIVEIIVSECTVN